MKAYHMANQINAISDGEVYCGNMGHVSYCLHSTYMHNA